jgi:GxxExxY protein
VNHEAHEEIEGHERRRLRMRLPSPLDAKTEKVMTRTIGCAIAVHRVLGPGFIESIYRKAMCLELESAGLSYEKERPVRVRYRGVDIPGQRVDLIVENAVVVELKSVQRIDAVHHAQTISYMKTVGARAGLLINFRVPILREGLKRFVL